MKRLLILLGLLLPVAVYAQSSTSYWVLLGTKLKPITNSYMVVAPGGFSGSSLVVSNLKNCTSVKTSGLGLFSCGSGGGTGTFGTGNVLTIGGAYVNKSGDTMTGALAIRPTAGSTTVGLNVAATMSGRSLQITGTGASPLIFTDVSRGRVGIGTSTPSVALQVVGQGVFSSTLFATALSNGSTGNNALVTVAAAGTNITRNVGDTNPALYVQQTNAGSTGDIFQAKNNSSTVFVIQQVGNVGIGSTGPKAKLDVVGTISGTNLIVSGVANFSGAVLIDTKSQSVKTLTMSGSNSPVAVVQNLDGAISYLQFYSNATGTNGINDGLTVGYNASAFIMNRENTNMSIGTNNFTRITISSSGLTGIGTTAPGSKLTVSGSIFVGKGAGNTAAGSPLAVSGAVIIGPNIGTTAADAGINLETIGTMSGLNLSVSQSAAFSGTVLVKGTLATKGTLSGQTLTVLAGNSYLLGTVGIGTTSAKAKLDVVGTVSGANLTISKNGSFSGSLTVLKNSVTKGQMSGTTLIVSGVSSFSGAANFKTNLTVFGVLSGMVLNVSKSASVSGALLVRGNTSVKGTISGATLNILNSTSYILGSTGIGVTSPKAKLDVLGTISGARLAISGNANITGTLLVVGTVTGRGSISGQTLAGGGGRFNVTTTGALTINGNNYYWPSTKPGSGTVFKIMGNGTISFYTPPAAGASTNYEKVVYISAANSTALTNPSSETAFDTAGYTIPANDLATGVCYEVHQLIDVTSVTTSTARAGFQVGGATFMFGTIGASTSTAGAYAADGYICATAAAGASVNVRGYFTTAVFGTSANPNNAYYAETTEATNGTLLIKGSFACGGSSTCSATQRIMIVKKLATTAF